METKGRVIELIKNVNLEDDYRITIAIDGVHVMVENLTIPDSCTIDIFKCEFDEFKNMYENEDWIQFVCALIDSGYLD